MPYPCSAACELSVDTTQHCHDIPDVSFSSTVPGHVVDLLQEGHIAITAAERVYAIPELMGLIYAHIEEQSRGSEGYVWARQARQKVTCLALLHKAGYRRAANVLFRWINQSAVRKMIESNHDTVSTFASSSPELN